MQLALGLFLIITAASAFAQQYIPTSAAPEFPDAVQPVSPGMQSPGAPTFPSPSALPDAPSESLAHPATDVSKQGPKQILGVIPSSRAVSPGTTPLPPTSRRSLNLAAPSAGYSSLTFVGGASEVTEASDANQQLNRGVSGPGKNCRRARVDKTDGSDWITSLLSITSHKGGSYCALGEGGFWRRGTYAATRAFVSHKYDGSFNVSEVPGSAIAPGFPTNYYPYQNYTGERLAARYASAVGRDALRNMFSEFWPDFAARVSHRHP